nr:sigma factor-like helix-turn-helix DNA-binding protein [Catenulispora rubra]
MAALLLLERLSPLERAVFVLREVFGFGFPEIANPVGRSEAACRQLAVRARRHMDLGRPRFEADQKEREELSARFFDALRDGDVGALRELLAADVQMIGDAGGKAPPLVRSVIGADNVARLLAASCKSIGDAIYEYAGQNDQSRLNSGAIAALDAVDADAKAAQSDTTTASADAPDDIVLGNAAAAAQNALVADSNARIGGPPVTVVAPVG